jgi:hypothetical protein
MKFKRVLKYFSKKNSKKVAEKKKVCTFAPHLGKDDRKMVW